MRAMPSGRRVILFAIVSFAVGCTFLVDFEEAPQVRDDGAADGGEPPLEDGDPAFPPPCDPAFPLAEVECRPTIPRPTCASDTTVFPSYPVGRARDADLVTCNGGVTPICVQHCPFGCAAMPPGYPDACDDCHGRPDGTYCTKDLRAVDGRNLGLAVDCRAGRAAMVYVCGVGRCATECPRAERRPSCCI
jgi:hypothetical protein